jgi:hypothetical protein
MTFLKNKLQTPLERRAALLCVVAFIASLLFVVVSPQKTQLAQSYANIHALVFSAGVITCFAVTLVRHFIEPINVARLFTTLTAFLMFDPVQIYVAATLSKVVTPAVADVPSAATVLVVGMALVANLIIFRMIFIAGTMLEALLKGSFFRREEGEHLGNGSNERN